MLSLLKSYKCEKYNYKDILPKSNNETARASGFIGLFIYINMRKKIDEYKSGELVNGVVFLRHISFGTKRKAVFLCVKCNKEMIKRFCHVRNGNQKMCKSCACETMRSKRNIQPKKETLKREVYRLIKNSALKRSKTFNLSYSYTIKEITKNCTYCGCEPNNLKENSLYKFKHHGLDRVNNNIGYVEDNVVSCCKTCNMGKNTLTLNEWMQYLDNLVLFRTNTIKKIK